MSACPGETVTIKTKVSDPDNDSVSLQWAEFRVGSYTGGLQLQGTDSETVTFTVPEDVKEGDTLHLVLTAKDNGVPELTRYHRVIISIK